MFKLFPGCKNFNWCMVDIESYDNVCTSAVASIGAVRFNIKTREVGDPFYCTIDPKSCKEFGLTFGKDTLEWWKQQSPEARAALRKDNISLDAALDMFSEWYSKEDTGKIGAWGQFDLPILDLAYRKVGKIAPWKFWNTVECRTIADMVGVKIDRTQGTHHNAMDDARIQAEFMINILNPKED